jgi:hypothetical protein
MPRWIVVSLVVGLCASAAFAGRKKKAVPSGPEASTLELVTLPSPKLGLTAQANGRAKIANMPRGGRFDDGGWHVGDCLMRRDGAKLIFFENGKGRFESTVRSEDSGDQFNWQWWGTTDDPKVTVVQTIAKTSSTLPRSADQNWSGDFDWAGRCAGDPLPRCFDRLSRVTWYSPGCH